MSEGLHSSTHESHIWGVSKSADLQNFSKAIRSLTQVTFGGKGLIYGMPLTLDPMGPFGVDIHQTKGYQMTTPVGRVGIDMRSQKVFFRYIAIMVY